VNGIEFTFNAINKKLKEFSEKSEVQPFFNVTEGMSYAYQFEIFIDN
jgi:hypothetical protein